MPAKPWAYGFAVASVLACTLIRWLLNPLLENQGLYLAFMIPVASSAYVGGPGPGLVSAVLSAAIASPLLFEFPIAAERASIAHVVLFAIESVAVILVICKLQQSRDEARQALAAAEAARIVAEEANRAKEDFVARVSHEWRTPLNTLSGWLWQLERRVGDHDFVARATASMRRAVDTQSRLVSDLLDYSRGSRGKLSIRTERLAVSEPVKRAVESISADATNRRLTLIYDEGCGDARIWGDPVRLEQVFANVLQNATKFTPPGGTIRVAFARSEDHIEVTVTDTGIGIRPEALPAIFDQFTQADERRDRNRGGLGLGLSIARDIVHLHGGSLSVSSAGLGTGASFCVRLPAATTHPSSAAPRRVGRESLLQSNSDRSLRAD
jgi:signal transduction histidine kinase